MVARPSTPSKWEISILFDDRERLFVRNRLYYVDGELLDRVSAAGRG